MFYPCGPDDRRRDRRRIFRMVGGLGVGVMVFIFGLTPSTPPIDVILIILSVVPRPLLYTSGGLDLLVKLAENSASPPSLYYVISAVYLLYLHFYVRNGACRL